MSQHAASPTPPPYAAPWMRATVGFGTSCSVRSMTASPFASARFCARLYVAIRFIQLRSAPAQNDGPLPASTTTRTPSSAPSASIASVSSAISVSLNALCTSGRLSVTMPMRLRTATSIVVKPAAAGVAFFLAMECPRLRSRPRVARHQFVGRPPARRRGDPREPRGDVRIGGPVDADLVRPEQVAAQREVGDRQAVADDVASGRRDARRECPMPSRRACGTPPARRDRGSFANVRMKR